MTLSQNHPVQLKDNPDLVKLRVTERWKGELSMIQGAGTTSFLDNNAWSLISLDLPDKINNIRHLQTFHIIWTRRFRTGPCVNFILVEIRYFRELRSLILFVHNNNAVRSRFYRSVACGQRVQGNCLVGGSLLFSGSRTLIVWVETHTRVWEHFILEIGF